MPFLKQCQFCSSGRVHIILLVRRVQRVCQEMPPPLPPVATSSTYEWCGRRIEWYAIVSLQPNLIYYHTHSSHRHPPNRSHDRHIEAARATHRPGNLGSISPCFCTHGIAVAATCSPLPPQADLYTQKHASAHDSCPPLTHSPRQWQEQQPDSTQGKSKPRWNRTTWWAPRGPSPARLSLTATVKGGAPQIGGRA
jgi:hypothetical protein